MMLLLLRGLRAAGKLAQPLAPPYYTREWGQMAARAGFFSNRSGLRRRLLGVDRSQEGGDGQADVTGT
ncbi:MAG: hypothetical protein KIS95_09860 [Anaerolineae bacterium]|uniref:hypothetical protein n=1 Tax=Promineifilum sp. TaxID=2664178 RepID=UPI002411A1D1|nr:hypothetical protein [Promineifilum sp.]MCW5847525.1 hypothetical protein [Anaerolineae bacterium]